MLVSIYSVLECNADHGERFIHLKLLRSFLNEFFNSYKANDREPGSIQIFRVTSQAMTVTIIVDYSRIGVKRKHYSFHSDRIVLIARLT